MDLTVTGLYTLSAIAVNELAQRLRKRDYNAVVKILFCAVLGLVAGYFGLGNLDVVTGVVAGLAAVGIHTTASATRK